MPGIPPRLYFAGFSDDQQAVGRRQLPLLTVNVPKVHIRAKLLEADAAIHALRGYESYFRSWDEQAMAGERFRRVDYNLIAGRTIFDEEWPGALQPDAATPLTLDWDRILGERKTGVVFVEAERAQEPYEHAGHLGAQTLVQVTDLGMAWKAAAGDLDAFVFSQSTGRPAAGAAVRLLTTKTNCWKKPSPIPVAWRI
jgi:uncharacterized protein YfaS (alpha-2-macroglobulin family)